MLVRESGKVLILRDRLQHNIEADLFLRRLDVLEQRDVGRRRISGVGRVDEGCAQLPSVFGPETVGVALCPARGVEQLIGLRRIVGVEALQVLLEIRRRGGQWARLPIEDPEIRALDRCLRIRAVDERLPHGYVVEWESGGVERDPVRQAGVAELLQGQARVALEHRILLRWWVEDEVGALALNGRESDGAVLEVLPADVA